MGVLLRSGPLDKVGQREWAKLEGEKLRALIAHVRRLRRKSGLKSRTSAMTKSVSVKCTDLIGDHGCASTYAIMMVQGMQLWLN